MSSPLSLHQWSAAMIVCQATSRRLYPMSDQKTRPTPTTQAKVGVCRTTKRARWGVGIYMCVCVEVQRSVNELINEL